VVFIETPCSAKCMPAESQAKPTDSGHEYARTLLSSKPTITV